MFSPALYLDYAATTPISEAALNAYNQVAQLPGNASSVHRAGQQARDWLERGRAGVAEALKVNPLEVIFNSGGTEGDNHVLLGLALSRSSGHLITSSTEHSAILNTCTWLEGRGFAVTYLQPDPLGRISPEQLEREMRPDTFLVSIMHANNEIGTVQDLAALAKVAHIGGALFHSDMVQSLGILPLELATWGIDFATFAAHKFYGPKGVGFVYVRRGLDLPPVMLGGGQEKGLRGGTHNVPGVYATGIAAQEAVQNQAAEYQRLRELQNFFTLEVAKLPQIRFNHDPQGSPKVVNLTALGTDGEALLMNLDLEGVAASSGSACSAGTFLPSHVLLALGMSEREARSSLRFSFGHGLEIPHLEQAVQGLAKAIERSRV